MTIKQLHDITPADQKIFIAWQGMTQALNRDNPLELDAYGKYAIAKIVAIAEDKLEAELLAQPVKEN